MSAPSPVSLSERRSSVPSWDAKIEEQLAQRAALAEAAEAGDAAAVAQYATLTADLAHSKERRDRAVSALVQAELRQAAAEAKTKEEARDIRAIGFDAEVQAITDGVEAALADLDDVAARIKAVLPTVQALANRAGLSMATPENMLIRLRGAVAFAFGPFLALPRADAKPVSPAARFAADTRADLARAGLAPPPRTTEEGSDNA